MVWSQATRARISAFLFWRTTLFCRNLNQVVAAGPKIAGGGKECQRGKLCLKCNWNCIGEGGKVDRPPPYKAMRPVRARSCFSSPFFSTSCWAIVSPVAKSTAVVTLWVRIGREASFIWYL